MTSPGRATLLCAVVCAGAVGTATAQELTRVLGNGLPAQQAVDTVRDPELSGDGRHLVFATRATNLTGGSSAVFQVMLLRFGDSSSRVLSRDPASQQLADGNSLAPVASDNAALVAFESTANNLVSTSTAQQILRVNTVDGTVLRVSQSSGGVAGNDVSRSPAMSANGRFVAFHTLATNLFPADTNQRADVLVKDLDTGNIELITRRFDGALADDSALPLTSQAMSADARHVVFSSLASNMVGGAGAAGGVAQVYLRDRIAGTTSLISRNSSGAAADNVSDQAAISSNGRFVAFRSVASNLGATGSRVFVLDRDIGALVSVPLPLAGSFSPPLSASASACREARVDDAGNLVMICNMASGASAQAFSWQRSTGALRLLSADRGVANGLGNAISGNRVTVDDRGVAWALESQASNLVAGDSNGVGDVFFPEALTPVFADGFEGIQ